MSRPITRRSLLRGGVAGGALCAASRLGLIGSTGSALWLAGPARAEGGAEPLLVVVFLRGGADGLHLVAPLGDPDYRSLRGDLALDAGLPIAPAEGLDHGDSDPGFHLHPAFAAIEDLVASGGLAVVHMAGSPESSRSHFEAQDQMEMGLGGDRPISAGWMARALGAQPLASAGGDDDPFSLLALTANPPLSLRGTQAFAIDDPARFGLPFASESARRALHEAYTAAGGSEVGRAGLRALDALDDFEQRMGGGVGARAARAGRGSGRRRAGIAEGVRHLESVLARGLPVRAAFLEGDGWDSHRGQGSATGSVARSVEDLAAGLAGLSTLDGPTRAVRFVVMTEFGRTVRRNGSAGTDHGHGGVMLVGGRGVRGGVHGRYTGLASERLFEGRDLPVHTDYRDVLAGVLAAHLGAAPPADSFPGHMPTPLRLFA